MKHSLYALCLALPLCGCADLQQPGASPPSGATTAAEAGIPVTTEAAGIYLQLGAFSARANAESFRDKIQTQLS